MWPTGIPYHHIIPYHTSKYWILIFNTYYTYHRINIIPLDVMMMKWKVKDFSSSTSFNLLKKRGGGGQGRQWRGLTGAGERKPRGPSEGLVRHARGGQPKGPHPLLPSCQLWRAVALLVDIVPGWARTTPTGPARCLPSPPPGSSARCPRSATPVANLSYLMT